MIRVLSVVAALRLDGGGGGWRIASVERVVKALVALVHRVLADLVGEHGRAVELGAVHAARLPRTVPLDVHAVTVDLPRDSARSRT